MNLIKPVVVDAARRRSELADEIHMGGGANHATVKRIAHLRRVSPPQAYRTFIKDTEDLIGVGILALEAETIMIDSSLALELRESLSRFDFQGGRLLFPYPVMIFQFSTPIPERIFFVEDSAESPELHELNVLAASVEDPYGILEGKAEDYVMGLLVAEGEDHKGKAIYNATALFASGDINRSKWSEDEPPEAYVFKYPHVKHEEAMLNKHRILQLATAILLYINCANVEVVRNHVSERVKQKRAQKGLSPLPEYHTTYIRPVEQAGYTGEREGEGESKNKTGRKIEKLVPVRQHFRRYANGQTIIIPRHVRGAEYAVRDVERVYKVPKPRGGWKPK